jgi:protein-ribulosamine 3-kinase
MSWEDVVIESLERVYKEKIELISVSPVGGGDINDAYQINTSEGDFFVKKNSASRFPGMFKKEAMGLEILDTTNTIRVPNLIEFGESGDEAFLILRFIRSGQRLSNFWDRFAHQLGNLHRHSNDSFGLDHNNYIGSLHQSNKKHKTWADFFINERLEVQVKLARNSGLIENTTITAFEKFYRKINDIFPIEQPALLHGDLWGGNFMVDEKGDPVIIDPAVYYGHREMDIAMTKLFGGFDSKFYDAYNRYYPLEKAWQERVDYCNLYPLMVHVNLFGQSYLGSVNSILNKFY